MCGCVDVNERMNANVNVNEVVNVDVYANVTVDVCVHRPRLSDSRPTILG